MKLTFPMLALIVLCTMLVTVRELCFKRAAHATSVWQTIQKPLTWFGVGLWAAELVLWLKVLQRVPLGIAFPATALGYVMILIGSAAILKEKVSMRHAIGALLVTVGVAILGASEL